MLAPMGVEFLFGDCGVAFNKHCYFDEALLSGHLWKFSWVSFVLKLAE